MRRKVNFKDFSRSSYIDKERKFKLERKNFLNFAL